MLFLSAAFLRFLPFIFDRRKYAVIFTNEKIIVNFPQDIEIPWNSIKFAKIFSVRGQKLISIGIKDDHLEKIDFNKTQRLMNRLQKNFSFGHIAIDPLWVKLSIEELSYILKRYMEDHNPEADCSL